MRKKSRDRIGELIIKLKPEVLGKGKTPDFSQLFMKLRVYMKFCTHVPRTCVNKRLVLDFHLFT